MLVDSYERCCGGGDREYGGSSGGLYVLISSLEDDDDGAALPTNARRRPGMANGMADKRGKSGEAAGKIFFLFL